MTKREIKAIGKRMDKIEERIKGVKKTMKAQLQEIALRYGYEPQSRQLIEEMAELTVAINKFWRANQKPATDENLDKMRAARSNIIEEIADVGIMLEQITYLLDAHEDVQEIMAEKINRQLERIKKESEGKK